MLLFATVSSGGVKSCDGCSQDIDAATFIMLFDGGGLPTTPPLALPLLIERRGTVRLDMIIGDSRRSSRGFILQDIFLVIKMFSTLINKGFNNR
ncbi:hypothetical protein OK016_05320 [Vibrio chagasii]|nr:hypothetical protein [Vibrio chagasii]